jgi:aspartate aminotransferase
MLPDGTEIKDGVTLSAHLLHEHHLALLPGRPFGAPEHVRLSFAASVETLSKAMDRLHQALAALH